MALTPELEAQILRYHHVEKWPIGTIARQLHVIMAASNAFAPAGLLRTACRRVHRASIFTSLHPPDLRNSPPSPPASLQHDQVNAYV
jgi:hypothetical protein